MAFRIRWRMHLRAKTADIIFSPFRLRLFHDHHATVTVPFCRFPPHAPRYKFAVLPRRLPRDIGCGSSDGEPNNLSGFNLTTRRFPRAINDAPRRPPTNIDIYSRRDPLREFLRRNFVPSRSLFCAVGLSIRDFTISSTQIRCLR